MSFCRKRLNSREKMVMIDAIKKVIDERPKIDADEKLCMIWSDYAGNVLKIVYKYTERIEFLFAIEEIKNYVCTWEVFGVEEKTESLKKAVGALCDLCKKIAAE